MNDEWLHKIHDRMADYEVDEPEGLWASIENARVENSGGLHTSRRRVIMLWCRRLSVAAALLAVVITACLYIIDNPLHVEKLPLSADESRQSILAVKRESPDNDVPQNIHSRNAATIPTYAAARKALSVSEQMEETTVWAESVMPIENDCQIKEVPNPQVAEQEKRDSVAKALKEKLRDTQKSGGKVFYASIAPRSSGNDRLSVSIYASGGTGSMMNHQSVGNFLNSATGPDNASWKDNTMLGILAFNQGRTIETDIKHRLPIRTGLSFTYNITDRLGIESGVSYTNLVSDIREGSEDHYVAGEQSLHYIGIPINLKYRFFSWQRLHLYGSAGVLGEKCVSAKMDKSFILNNRTEETMTERISDKPLQWSVNASAGVQIDIINSIGLYAEPGISYYFKDGTDLQTIYKEKPLNFNLNFGIRFSFGQ